MTFIAPEALFLLLAVPVLVVGYVWVVRRRAASESDLGTMAHAHTRGGKPLGWRRHVPAVLFLVGVTVLLVGLARPEATLDLPRREGTVILAFDVSSSMTAKDLEPTRMVAAKQAARGLHRRPAFEHQDRCRRVQRRGIRRANADPFQA